MVIKLSSDQTLQRPTRRPSRCYEGAIAWAGLAEPLLSIWYLRLTRLARWCLGWAPPATRRRFC